MGPYGSAKTTSCFQKILNAAAWQVPQADGVRRIRVACIRATYGQLEKTVMKDWFAGSPRPKKIGTASSNTHNLTVDVPLVGRLEIEMIFIGIGELKAEEVFKGMPITVLWLNEVDTLHREILNYGLPRVGRYPVAKDGGCAWSGVIADFNAPEVDNWTYDLLVNKNLGVPSDELLAKLQAQYGKHFGIEFWRQPSGRSPDAENLDNLPPGYYDRLIIGFAGNDNKVRRFVDNEFGAVNNGQPVYPEFNDAFHVAKEFVQCPSPASRSTSGRRRIDPGGGVRADRRARPNPHSRRVRDFQHRAPRSSCSRWARASSGACAASISTRMWPNGQGRRDFRRPGGLLRRL
jgi:hypothetical protein